MQTLPYDSAKMTEKMFHFILFSHGKNSINEILFSFFHRFEQFSLETERKSDKKYEKHVIQRKKVVFPRIRICIFEKTTNFSVDIKVSSRACPCYENFIHTQNKINNFTSFYFILVNCIDVIKITKTC